MRELDLTGLLCPHVVLRLAEQMRALPAGSRIRVIATDPLSAIDVPFYLGKAGHQLLSRDRQDARIVFIIECGDPPGAG